MTPSKLFDLANASGGTLYLMALLMLVALTVIIERSRYLSKMQQDGDSLIDLLHDGSAMDHEVLLKALQQYENLPHASVVHASLIEPDTSERDVCAGHLEEAIMREVPTLDRSLWVLDTVITLAPLLGLFGTVVGMIELFGVQDAAGANPGQLAHGISVALYNTGFGLAIAMPALVFYRYFRALVDGFVIDMEQQAIRFVDTVLGARN